MGRLFLTKLIALSGACIVSALAVAQTSENPAGSDEQQLESITEYNADAETEDDTYMQQMEQYVKHPVNLNTASETELQELKVLDPLQIQQLISYRALFGKFISIYELQAIPGWSIPLIRRIIPYVSVESDIALVSTIAWRLKAGQHSILLRAGQTLEKSKGFLNDTSGTTGFYPGSPQKILLRYKYQYKNLLQYGLLGEKDAGEQFFKGQQKQGFDFYSLHFFAKNIGAIKALALGDFTINLGQGLVQWQSLAFKKSLAVTNIKREATVLRPYNSSGEINFHRGIGLTLAKNKWEATAFVSYRHIDANLVTDTTGNAADFISALQASGYHRTKGEAADKGVQQQLVYGGNLSLRSGNMHVGINSVHYQFKLPLYKADDPYNHYALSGKTFGNYSVDYSYTYKNMHVFGEAAISREGHTAFLNGILMSVAPDVDMSLLYRNIAAAYQSLYAAAFTENTAPSNERGGYAGISVHPGNIWRIDAYADIYHFPWLKFRVDAPSGGSDYAIQLTYKPSRQLEMYTRLHVQSASQNSVPGQYIITAPVAYGRQNWRTHFTYKPNRQIVLSCRTEQLWLSGQTAAPEAGFLTYFDVFFKPANKPWSASLRWQYFDTDSYNSRIYTFEKDVLYGFSIPVFYEKGAKYYVNFKYEINRNFTMWIKWGKTAYFNKTLIGSGLDEIKGNKRNEIKLQIMYNF